MLNNFLHKHHLPSDYQIIAARYFDPLIETLIAAQRNKGNTLFVGINGCQGSGKTTLADYLCWQLHNAGFTACALSIDDFYLTQTERSELAKRIHPLFRTRGVPTTHDVALATRTLKALSQSGEVSLPQFDKAIDDRMPKSSWQTVSTPLQVVILEGWCVAIPPQNDKALALPINDLEREYDPHAIWRTTVNNQLRDNYPSLWSQLDTLIMLKAPAFECVYTWRLEQEEKLRQHQTHQDATGIMSAEQIRTFIAHYERLTRHALACLPAYCDHVFELDNHRGIHHIYVNH